MAGMKLTQLVTDNVVSLGCLACAPLLASYAPRDLPKMYFNQHLRRYARRLVPFLDPFVTIDIVSNSSRSGQSSVAYEEVKAYLTKKFSPDVLEFCAEGADEDGTLLLSLCEGQEVTDHFQDTTVWWLLIPPRKARGSWLESSESCLRLMFPQMKRELILNDYLPHVRRTGRNLMFVTIDFIKKPAYEEGKDLKSSDAFEEVKAYLSSACSRNVLKLRAEGTAKGDSFLLSLCEGQEVADRFQGITLWWLSVPTDGISSSERSCLRLTFPQEHRRLIEDEYLPHIRREGRNLLCGTRCQRLYTNKRDCSYMSGEVWSHVEFKHPTTFDTMAMHPTKKSRIMEDLDRFSRNKDYYFRIGKPWKRGYLLYGPPGTGKSSMIAAMANHLNYDIYDIELTTVSSNSDLRKLFVETKSKSIIVIEDIDCCFDDFNGQRTNQGGSQKKISQRSDDDDSTKVTLSGLLNFIDGVWSAQSSEQIIVLTPNFPDKLDAALIRRGRMDMHVEMSYCCFEAFKMLCRNYLGVEEHPLFGRVEELLQMVEITPADVAECLLPSQADVLGSHDRAVETCLGHLIDELKKKTEEKKAKDKVEDKAAAKPKRQRRN